MDFEAIPFKKRNSDDNDSFCRKENGKLVVEVQNKTSSAKSVPVRVSYREYGTDSDPKAREAQEKMSGSIPANDSKKVKFNCPADGCYDPECVFDITINPGPEEVYYRGVCKKGPDLVPLPDDDFKSTGSYWLRDNSVVGLPTMTVTIQNQGNENAAASKFRVNIKGYGPLPPFDLRALKPSEIEKVTFPIPVTPPNSFLDRDIEATVTLDVTNQVAESNETNNEVSGNCLKGPDLVNKPGNNYEPGTGEKWWVRQIVGPDQFMLVNVWNDGSLEAGPSEIQVTAENPTGAGLPPIDLGTYFIPALAPDDFIEVSVTIPNGPPGNLDTNPFNATVTVDSANQVIESNENNNVHIDLVDL